MRQVYGIQTVNCVDKAGTRYATLQEFIEKKECTRVHSAYMTHMNYWLLKPRTAVGVWMQTLKGWEKLPARIRNPGPLVVEEHNNGCLTMRSPAKACSLGQKASEVLGRILKAGCGNVTLNFMGNIRSTWVRVGPDPNTSWTNTIGSALRSGDRDARNQNATLRRISVTASGFKVYKMTNDRTGTGRQGVANAPLPTWEEDNAYCRGVAPRDVVPRVRTDIEPAERVEDGNNRQISAWQGGFVLTEISADAQGTLTRRVARNVRDVNLNVGNDDDSVAAVELAIEAIQWLAGLMGVQSPFCVSDTPQLQPNTSCLYISHDIRKAMCAKGWYQPGIENMED